MLRRAWTIFADAGQDHWAGRAEAACGVALYRAGNDAEALESFDSALHRLDEELDGSSVASILQTRAGLLANLGRRDEARAGYTKAVAVAMRSGATGISLSARVSILEMALEDGRSSEVAKTGERILERSDLDDFQTAALYCRLLVAEAQASLGRYGRARQLLAEVRRTVPAEVATRAEILELSRLEPSDGDMLDVLRRVRGLVDVGYEEALKRA
jgi:tetratricopeptide (TPR) repeat protein